MRCAPSHCRAAAAARPPCERGAACQRSIELKPRPGCGARSPQWRSQWQDSRRRALPVSAADSAQLAAMSLRSARRRPCSASPCRGSRCHCWHHCHWQVRGALVGALPAEPALIPAGKLHSHLARSRARRAGRVRVRALPAPTAPKATAGPLPPCGASWAAGAPIGRASSVAPPGRGGHRAA